MTSARQQALILLIAACAFGASASQVLAATARANAAHGKEAADAGVKAGEKMRRLAQASDIATQELRGGFNRLKRICEYGARNNPDQTGSPAEAVLISQQTRGDIRELKDSLDRILGEYKKSSSITQNAGCKYMPAFFPLGGACQRFQEDSERLSVANQTVRQLTTQVLERLDLYDQYWQLENQGCTRPGFALKLWSIEEKSLWPLLLEAPATLKSLLPSAAENE